MALTIETPQVETTVASMLWDSFGIELTIFAVTTLCALAVRTLTGKEQAPLKFSNKSAGFAKTAPATRNCPTTASAKAPWREVPASVPERRRPPSPGRPSTAPARSTQTASDRQPSFKDPASLARTFDEIITVVKEQQSMKSAVKAITLYSEFQACLSAPGAPSMEQVARRSRHTPAEFFTTVVHCAVRAGRSNLVGDIINDMVRFKVGRSLQFYEVTMKQLASQKHYRQALAAYDRLKEDGLKPSVVTCSCLIGFAAEVGELSRAVEFFKELSSISTPSIRAYMTVLRVHAKRQDWPASLAVFREMTERGVEPDTLVLNFVLATGVSTDKVEAAAALAEEVQRERPGLPDVVSYNTIVKGYTQRGDAEGALKIIAQMNSVGVAPNSITFNTAMDAAVRGGKVTEAWKLLGCMRRAGMSPDKFTCSILLKCFTKGGHKEYVPEALNVLAEVGHSCDSGLLSTLYSNILEAAAADAALVAKTFSQMRRNGISPSFNAATQRRLLQILPRSAEGEEDGLQSLGSGAAAVKLESELSEVAATA